MKLHIKSFVLCLLSFFHSCSGWITRTDRLSIIKSIAPSIFDRRRILHQLIGSPVLCLSTSLILNSKVSYAATPTTPGEAIRKGASGLPGYGQSDIFYPASWLGVWNMKRETIIHNDDGTTSSMIVEYPVRFIQSIQDDAVIADRAYNKMSYIQATGSNNETPLSITWEETNPNDTRITYRDGTTFDLKVTKRATEKTDTTVSSSEFQRIIIDNPSTSTVPNISAQRVMTKWKQNDDNTKSIDAIELVYSVGGSGSGNTSTDPMSYGISNQQQELKLLSKSRLHLER